MRRLVVVSLLLHALLGVGLLTAVNWRPPVRDAEPARIEVLFGHGGSQPTSQPDRPAGVDAPVAPPVPATSGELPPVGGATPGIAASPHIEAAAHVVHDTPGVRFDEPDELTIPAREDTGNHQPDYPPEAARLRKQGRVVLRLHIDAQGDVASIELLQSSGHAVLDNAATAELARWRFLPAQRDGQAIAWDRDQPVDFIISQ
jgi:protein TonB